MTPIEKAVQLMDKYRTYLRIADKYEYLDPEDEVHLAKQCALTLVDEILNENSKRGGKNDVYSPPLHANPYPRQVYVVSNALCESRLLPSR